MRASVFALGVALSVAGTGAGGTGGEVLDELRWSKRVLLVLTPTVDDPRALALSEALARRACGALERDLVLMQIPATGPASLSGKPLSQRQAASIRERIGEDSAFLVLLLGKDGGVKLREASVPDLDTVFALIDAMPMRREEMRTRSTACAD